MIVDLTHGADAPCQYAIDGDIVINIPITRYIGVVDLEGHLVDLDDLVSRGTVRRTATLRLPAWDIDFNTVAPWPQERDIAYINGHELGLLYGQQQTWRINELTIDLAYLKFPRRGTGNSPPEPANNELRIRIDTANPPSERHWCMGVAWVELSFSAIAPAILVHGIHAGPSIWGDFQLSLSDWGVPNDPVTLGPDATIASNGELLQRELGNAVTRFGASRCHVVTHSKGGLDTRYYLGHYAATGPDVLSVTTLSTPFQGSVLADLLSMFYVTPDGRFTSTDPSLQTLITYGSALAQFGFVGRPPGIYDIATWGVGPNIAPAYPPTSVRWFHYGADADLDGDLRISLDEAAGLAPLVAIALDQRLGVVQSAYNTLGTAASLVATLVYDPVEGAYVRQVTIGAAPGTHQPNDVAVTTTSAAGLGGYYVRTLDANHTTVRAPSIIPELVGRLLTEFPFEEQ